MNSTAILPKPRRHVKKPGTLRLGPAIHVTGDSRSAQQIKLLEGYLTAAGFTIRMNDDTATGTISCISREDPVYDAAGFCDESYSIEVTENGIRIEGANREGTARGIQTLRQLLPPGTLKGSAGISPFQTAAELTRKRSLQGPLQIPAEIPCCSISDRPEYRWRGIHLDVSRHFFTAADVARFIDLAALHRLNRVHMHLTDDQGWRVEIEQFPLLTQKGAYRSGTLIGHYNDLPRRYDNTGYGGFYTKQELLSLNAFAAERGIVLVPEIDMPGHMQAAVASYPEWGTTDEHLEVSQIWGISDNILNVEPGTITAMKGILSEVMEIFPSLFIHIGGDEAPKDQWKASSRVQKRMKEYGCRTEEELQGWFMREIDSFLQEKGRRSIGWDEIIEGGLADSAAVMSWRGEEGGIAAASAGHDVVMTPEKYTYLDHYQNTPIEKEPLAIGGYTPLSSVYGFNPVPNTLTTSRQKHILGAQCQLWTEYISSRDQLDYMAYPRTCALAENLWLGEGEKNYTEFLDRLSIHMERLYQLGVNAASLSPNTSSEL